MISEIIAHLTGSRCGVLAYLMVVSAKLISFAPMLWPNKIRGYFCSYIPCEKD